MSLPYPPPYQDLATLSAHICAAESTIENWVRLGLFPEPKKVGRPTVRQNGHVQWLHAGRQIMIHRSTPAHGHAGNFDLDGLL
jgi:hypothetical protein